MLIKVTLSSDIEERTKHSLQTAYIEDDNIHLYVRKAKSIHFYHPTQVEMFGYEGTDGADSIVQTLDFTYYVTSYWVEDD